MIGTIFRITVTSLGLAPNTRNINEDLCPSRLDLLEILFLDVMLKCCCRILFTGRSRYEHQTSLEVKEFSEEVPVALMGKFYEAEKKIGLVEEIMRFFYDIPRNFIVP